jgi:drug/metabolite transporter superfamily protein YnfA
VLLVVRAAPGSRRGFKPDRYDLTGAAICLLGVAVIMFARRASA